MWSQLEDYEEGGGEDGAIVDLQNFGEDDNWWGSLVGGQLDDLHFGLSEGMEALDVGWRHVGSWGIQRRLYEDDEEEYEFDDLWMTIVVQLFLVWCVHISEPSWEIYLFSFIMHLFSLKQKNYRFQT